MTYLLCLFASTYACPVWGYAAISNLKIMITQHNIAIRTVCDVKWFISNTEILKALEYPSFKEFVIRLGSKIFNNIDIHENEAIKDIPKYNPDPKIKRPRNVLIPS
ncbi:hypothetical protein AVEN_20294-1 [Araneus ventricosus]|uniref:RNA-directed DNA polymerase from mobile element jockey n=1 Tax=Araneus ventricosus TaxID=182803 RepID=A0A4Y2TVJ6_ARAVE|nr:hypothetical protein AVEN_20294-1 [Araneus ventricosus]